MDFIRLLFTAALLVPEARAVAVEIPINTPGPILQPAYPACEQFHLATLGEDCNGIITAAGISRFEFFRINPAIEGEAHCQDKIIPNTWYCVRSRSPKGGIPDPAVPPSHGNGDIPKPTDEPQHKPDVPQGARPWETGVPLETTTTTEEESKITPGPPVPTFCNFGDCWYEFGQLSFGPADIQQHATELCTSIFNMECNHDQMGFPENVLKGCKNCEELSSACPCWTGGKYHTYTKNPVLFHRPKNTQFVYPG